MLSKLSQAFPADRGFFELIIVKNTLIFLSSLSFIAFVFICLNSNLVLDLSYHGFNNFFTIFKFPIGVLSLSVPLLAVYAANHRSEQTRTQIAHISSQNTFKNYFDHLDSFENYISKIKKGSLLNFVGYRQLHRTIYSNAHTGDLSICSNFLSQINKYFELIDKLSNGFQSDHEKAQGRWVEAYLSIYDASEKLLNFLHLESPLLRQEHSPITLSNGQTVALPLQSDLSLLLKLVISLTDLLNQILLFDPKYSTPYYINLILDIDTSQYAVTAQKIDAFTGDVIDVPFRTVQFNQRFYDSKCPLGHAVNEVNGNPW